LQINIFIAYAMSILCNNTQFEDKSRNWSYVKSDMKRHPMTKNGYFVSLSYGYNKSLVSVLSPNQLDIFTKA